MTRFLKNIEAHYKDPTFSKYLYPNPISISLPHLIVMFTKNLKCLKLMYVDRLKQFTKHLIVRAFCVERRNMFHKKEGHNDTIHKILCECHIIHCLSVCLFWVGYFFHSYRDVTMNRACARH